jgi:hypothetical protein
MNEPSERRHDDKDKEKDKPPKPKPGPPQPPDHGKPRRHG